MKSILLIICYLVFLISNIFANENKENLTSFYGVKNNGGVTSKFRNAKLSLNGWLEEASSKYKGKTKIKFYDSFDYMYGEFKDNELDIITVDLPFFFKHEEEIKKYSSTIWTISMSNKLYDEYYLISNKSLKLKDLNNKTIVLKNGDSSSLSWLEKNFYELNKTNKINLLNKINFESKESTVILDVFFKKNDYGIVTKEAWDVITQFNPSIKKSVTIIKKSKKIFLPFIGLISKKMSKKNIDIFFKLSEDLKKFANINKNSGSLNNFPSFDTVIILNETSLEKLRQYYNKLFTLQNKYK